MFRYVAGKRISIDNENENSKITFEWLVEPRLYLANGFRFGVSWIQEKEDGPWKLIDKTGKVIVDDFKAEIIFAYNEKNMLAQFMNNGGKNGFVDLSGDVVTPPLGERLSQDIVDSHGKIMIPYHELKSIQHIAPRLFAVENKSGKWSLINKRGEMITGFIFYKNLDEKKEYVGPNIYPQDSFTLPIRYVLSPDVLAVEINGEEGLMDFEGRWILPASYDKVFDGGEGLIGLEKDGKVGFVDSEGKTVIDFRFSGTSIVVSTDKGRESVIRRSMLGPYYTFSEGLAVALLSPIEPPPTPITAINYNEITHGVIDKSGKMLFSYKGACGRFENSFIHAWAPHTLIFIDHSGARYQRSLPSGIRLLYISWDGSRQGIAAVQEIVTAPKWGKVGYLKFRINQGGESND